MWLGLQVGTKYGEPRTGKVTKVVGDLKGPELFLLHVKCDVTGNTYEYKVSEVNISFVSDMSPEVLPTNAKGLFSWLKDCGLVTEKTPDVEMDFRVDKTMPADPDLRGSYVRIIPGTLQGFAFELAYVVSHDLIEDKINVRLAKDNRLVKGFRYKDLRLVRKA